MHAETEDVKFKLFVFDNIDLSSLSTNEIEILTDAIINFSEDRVWIKDERGLKYSLIKCAAILKNYIYGWISQEHVLEQHLYDDKKIK